MEFVAAKCSNCGGDLRLPDDKKQVKCMYCGFDIMVQEAINVAGANIENWLKLAASAEETGNYEEAYKYFTQVLEFEPDNYIALLGKGVSAGNLFTHDKFRSEELIKGVTAAVENSPDDKKQEVKLQAAYKISQLCSNFRELRRMFRFNCLVNDIRYSSSHDLSMRFDVIQCLELAHEYDPENEDVIVDLCSEYSTLSVGADNEDDHYVQLKENFLSKLEVLNSKLASNFRETNKKHSEERKKINTTSGSGCLVTLIFFLLTSSILLIFIFG